MDQSFSYSERKTAPAFLTLPDRTAKPRRLGVTHLLDKGLSVGETRERLAAAAAYIDIWKFGWGTAYVDPDLESKIALLRENNVLTCTGGTLLELAWHQRRVDEFFGWAESVGFPCVEVSCGSVSMERAEKSRLIKEAARHFTVLSEIGKKNETSRVSADEWASDAYADATAGSTWVITEGRESGTVGLYDADGAVRGDIADAVVGSVGLDVALLEAPRKDQQTWLIKRFGSNVNIGNVAAVDALAVETLRLGLRSDTAQVDDHPTRANHRAGRDVYRAGVTP
jgi:phosphosulfolactate synthase